MPYILIEEKLAFLLNGFSSVGCFYLLESNAIHYSRRRHKIKKNKKKTGLLYDGCARFVCRLITRYREMKIKPEHVN
ncbi:hypothetical protein EUGRSUZ_F00943 [Eucalyptus grandis]|uniref:Uncharacterized protein n=2 Tax=Eucalyptus grandis TaxID=71139 RepID=A0A059BN63_EUCGR|nr:hypothetical protein EUGRSUZ_F00943 [Eucalyptus grandis]